MSSVKHMGLFQFKDGVSGEQIEECFTELVGMVGQIPGLEEVIHGPYESDEGLNDGFTHGFIMTFTSAQARDDYLPHPVHERVKNIVLPRLERVVVFDFEA